MRVVLFALTTLVSVLAVAHETSASVFVKGAYYRLGDDDPVALPEASAPTRGLISLATSTSLPGNVSR